MDIVVSGAGRLTADSLSASLHTSCSDGLCVIDLANASFVDPAGLVAIAATVERATVEGRRVQVVPPSNVNCRNYLARMQLGLQLEKFSVVHGLGTVHSHKVGDRLQELRRFDHESGLEEVANTIVRFIVKADSAAAQPLYQALFEIGVNAVEHSGRGGGFVALQTFPTAGHVAFAVADSGRGLRSRLAQTMTVASDESAIRLAARKHVSSTGTGGRGRGITGVIELTGQHAGAVTMISGTSQGDFTNGHWDPRVTRLHVPFLGTLAHARLALEGRLDL